MKKGKRGNERKIKNKRMKMIERKGVEKNKKAIEERERQFE